jgi:hypothetical protein
VLALRCCPVSLALARALDNGCAFPSAALTPNPSTTTRSTVHGNAIPAARANIQTPHQTPKPKHRLPCATPAIGLHLSSTFARADPSAVRCGKTADNTRGAFTIESDPTFTCSHLYLLSLVRRLSPQDANGESCRSYDAHRSHSSFTRASAHKSKRSPHHHLSTTTPAITISPARILWEHLPQLRYGRRSCAARPVDGSACRRSTDPHSHLAARHEDSAHELAQAQSRSFCTHWRRNRLGANRCVSAFARPGGVRTGWESERAHAYLKSEQEETAHLR